ncbi:L-2-amino-thiazoline-4-carboxylic acid hydrolase [Eubacteriales bacterium OttesenSCG-928-M02]|nr:L-2-amino-thiazoline-4-carboxylic acid hydrolase [Eubacteriales bacterium OttesenSCG-928-M02]
MANTLILDAPHHAALFGYLTRETLATLGKDGENAVKEIVILYGNQRGVRMAMRATAAGYPLDMVSYNGFREWQLVNPDSAHTQGEPPKGDADYHISYSLTCPWHQAWKAYGMEAEAPYYCRYVDKALLAGFNPNLRLEIPKLLTQGDDCCEMHWMDYVKTDEDAARIEKIALENDPVMPWGYHLAHLYCSFIAVLSRYPNTRDILEKAKADFLAQFGPNSLVDMEAFLHMNFAALPY